MKNPHWQDIENLILVAGHAVYTADNFECPDKDENWFLQDFQKGEPPFYIEHIRKGVDLANEDPKSLLVFSGGQTRLEAGPRSEAQSYWMIANHFKWWWRTNVKLRSTTEEFARDSFENLLFSICRFYECVEEFPEKITVVSWKFKAERFDLHRTAIRLTEEQFKFVPVNQPMDLKKADDGEKKNARVPFGQDPYGTFMTEKDILEPSEKLLIDGLKNKIVEKKKTISLKKKREERNPFNRQHPYEQTCPYLKDLLQYKGRDKFLGTLPWPKVPRKPKKK